ncbi:MAG: DUF4834 family protein [Bacteroidales bacterium]
MLRIIFKGILYFLIVYYLYKVVDRLLFGDRRAIEKERKRQAKEKERIFREYKRREGKITLDPGQGSHKKFRDNQGEYVDYEEVK